MRLQAIILFYNNIIFPSNQSFWWKNRY